ncbi:hypothetical protein QBC32DRAFT_363447 [Pseudoneurospora amorphoporcata]|uniref:Uncharacterized protein n=1 Tax=Pseudoneurospora amorphoporcata TaxID=241081 RepID=A0AAN6NR13_9PEZI|nr:hypothetical protein QBC32DRAFT_363447 [Pseudoneurospora amorphoporcata]
MANAAKQKEYQIQISWPFKWESREVAKPDLAMHLLDGNALGMTASEAFKRRNEVEFPNVEFTREALYGHSWGGIFTIWALITRPDWFDTFFPVSPAIYWNNGSILGVVTDKFGNGAAGSGSTPETEAKPKFFLGYGALNSFRFEGRLRRRRRSSSARLYSRASVDRLFP